MFLWHFPVSFISWFLIGTSLHPELPSCEELLRRLYGNILFRFFKSLSLKSVDKYSRRHIFPAGVHLRYSVLVFSRCCGFLIHSYSCLVNLCFSPIPFHLLFLFLTHSLSQLLFIFKLFVPLNILFVSQILDVIGTGVPRSERTEDSFSR